MTEKKRDLEKCCICGAEVEELPYREKEYGDKEYSEMCSLFCLLTYQSYIQIAQGGV